jgi:hypothetical protein
MRAQTTGNAGHDELVLHGKLPLVDIFYTSAAFEAEEHPHQAG